MIKITILPEDFDKDFLANVHREWDSPTQYESPHDCPLARAIKRHFGLGGSEIAVLSRVCDIKHTRYRISPSFDALTSIAVYKSGEPYTLTLTLR